MKRKVLYSFAMLLCSSVALSLTSCGEDEPEVIDEPVPEEPEVVHVPATPIDLGLSVRWASYNLGATSNLEIGSLFAWGETKTKEEYTQQNYKFWTDVPDIYNTYYNRDLASQDDAAAVLWGKEWHMPTESEMQELVDSCTWVWTTSNGVDGYAVISKKNNNRIFLPASPDMYESKYWTGRCSQYDNRCARTLTLNESSYYIGEVYRADGVCIRPVFYDGRYYTLTYNVNHEFGEVFSFRIKENTNPVKVIDCEFGRSGYKFICWNTMPDGSGTDYYANDTLVLTSDLTLYCIWAKADEGVEHNGHYYVDLGLKSGVKWATYNIGADAPEVVGSSFAWGETEPKEVYDWSTYKYCWESSKLTKYCTDPDRGKDRMTDGKTVLDAEDDAAAVNWGGNWRMPTKEEFEELVSSCVWKPWVINGVDGFLVVGPNGKGIFLPVNDKRWVYCWSSSLSDYNGYNNSIMAYLIDIKFEKRQIEKKEYYIVTDHRCNGRFVRPVCP